MFKEPPTGSISGCLQFHFLSVLHVASTKCLVVVLCPESLRYSKLKEVIS